MADPPAPGGGKSQFGFLGRKIGPLPVWAWAAIAAGGYYWYTHFGPGSKRAAPTAAAAAPARTQVIVIRGQPPRPPRRRRPPPPRRGAAQPVAQPVQAAAPMTAGDIYGTAPTAMPDGTVYQSGQPTDAELGGAYVPAGF